MMPVASGVSSAFAAFGPGLSGVRSGTNVPFSSQTACPGGGSVGIAGSLTSTVSDSGSGQVNLNEQVTFTNCLSSGVLLRGHPNLTLSGQFNQGSLQYDCAANFDLSGGGTFNGSITVQYPIGTTATTMACAGLLDRV